MGGIRLRSILFTVVPLVVALVVSTAAGDHCETYETAQPELDTNPGGALPGPRYYWDDDPCQPCMYSTWVYEESNGIDGLQRGDEVVDGTCHGMIRSDTITF